MDLRLNPCENAFKEFSYDTTPIFNTEHTPRDGGDTVERPVSCNAIKTVWTDERAQTVEDYALGMGYFLITIMFVFAFLTGVTLPYESASGNGQDIRADRVANTLVQDTLSGGAEGRQKRLSHHPARKHSLRMNPVTAGMNQVL